MIGVDTNVLVRYLVRDDEEQFEAARRLIDRAFDASEPVMISLAVMAETEWLLRSRYDLPKADIAAAFSALLDAGDLVFEDEPKLEHVLYAWKDSRADFTDCLINARHQRLGCRATATFDARAFEVEGVIEHFHFPDSSNNRDLSSLILPPAPSARSPRSRREWPASARSDRAMPTAPFPTRLRD